MYETGRSKIQKWTVLRAQIGRSFGVRKTYNLRNQLTPIWIEEPAFTFAHLGTIDECAIVYILGWNIKCIKVELKWAIWTALLGRSVRGALPGNIDS